MVCITTHMVSPGGVLYRGMVCITAYEGHYGDRASKNSGRCNINSYQSINNTGGIVPGNDRLVLKAVRLPESLVRKIEELRGEKTFTDYVREAIEEYISRRERPDEWVERIILSCGFCGAPLVITSTEDKEIWNEYIKPVLEEKFDGLLVHEECNEIYKRLKREGYSLEEIKEMIVKGIGKKKTMPSPQQRGRGAQPEAPPIPHHETGRSQSEGVSQQTPAEQQQVSEEQVSDSEEIEETEETEEI